MRTCPLCPHPILPRQKTVSMVGGFFDVEDPDFFVEDQDIMKESYAHFECLTSASVYWLAKGKDNKL